MNTILCVYNGHPPVEPSRFPLGSPFPYILFNTIPPCPTGERTTVKDCLYTQKERQFKYNTNMHGALLEKFKKFQDSVLDLDHLKISINCMLCQRIPSKHLTKVHQHIFGLLLIYKQTNQQSESKT